MQKRERSFPSRQLVLSELSKISVTVNSNVIRELKGGPTGRFPSHWWPNYLQIQAAYLVDKQSFHKCQWCNDSVQQLLHIRHQLIYCVELAQSKTTGSIGFTLRDYSCRLSCAFYPVPVHITSVNISNCHSADLWHNYFYPGNSLTASFLKSFCINPWVTDQHFLRPIWHQHSWHISHVTHLLVQIPKITAVRQRWSAGPK